MPTVGCQLDRGSEAPAPSQVSAPVAARVCLPAPLQAQRWVERLPDPPQGVGLVTITDCLLDKTFEKLHVQRSCMAPGSKTLSSLPLDCMGRWSSSRPLMWPSTYKACRVVEKSVEDIIESLYIVLVSKSLDGAPDNSRDKIPLPCILFEQEDLVGLDTDSR
ncbi:Trafficking protein particle complex subunit 9 [Camelus dromedarius]|uniref:Trafficking protein particle complex subunit 9 n=1 Tax=Camelus dromedarius TaxID=9838 RepID=A0A5N4CU75_CAMDR|nr:Trafficking protein particle complex subunit 9 [Camelus dromedarius]